MQKYELWQNFFMHGKEKGVIIIIIYFENINFSRLLIGLDVCSILNFSTKVYQISTPVSDQANPSPASHTLFLQVFLLLPLPLILTIYRLLSLFNKKLLQAHTQSSYSYAP